ncbi:discoidin domain-containing protein [Mesonia sp.]|uniref:discoidin domain-containing protein n=1 Tax=Mesonia sp. TaxID=1960830 RepID=UPI00175E7D50|nr:discoidin domain-containing protein [Mesonia sp.]HIB38124.1 beta-mannosidase [Mesonia sp.]
MRKFNLLFFLLSISFSALSQTKTVSLNSDNQQISWQIKPEADLKADGFAISKTGFKIDDYVPGVVPGIVFTSYVEAGKEKDPNFANNINEVDESFYNRPFWYRTEFKLPEDYKKGQRVWLHFDNTNRYADFYFNGTKISGSKNTTKDVSGHMLRSKFDITSLINKDGKNAIAVLIYDADQKKTRDAKDGFGVTASPTYLSAAGWDWMPYVPGRLAGITGNVYLKITGEVTMEDPWVRSQLESNEVAYLSISSALKNTSEEKKEATISGVISPGDIKFSEKITIDPKSTSTIYIDRKKVEELLIKNPKLWWPNGYGDPNLYTLKLSCSIDDKVSDEKEITFGIKDYDYRFEKNAAGWPVMVFYINGQKLFIKGGNWGMSEYLLRCRGEEYEKKIKLHKDMNYNMIRLWTGSITDDAFYEYCDKYGIMVWDDFWLYVAYNDVANDEDFKKNALDKVKRLRNHPSLALWCGANETHPKPELDNYLRGIVATEDHNDRMYKSSSNQDGLSGSGWWGNRPPKEHFENSGSNLAWNKPPYPYGSDRGYGMRSEIGTATFPTYESIVKFIPKDDLWPLPTDEELKDQDDNVWNKHYFGKEASNANPVAYKTAVNEQYGTTDNLEDFAEKAQYLNLEVMRGMYEAWNDKMWNDASGILIWMSQSAYPSFVWQTYDYYYDATGSYWGAKIASEPLHIQWNSSSNSVKAINTTSKDVMGATAKATIYNLNGKELPDYGKTATVDVKSSNNAEAFVINFAPYNLAKDRKVVASSEVKSATNLTDASSGSRWESEAEDNQWIYVDLGENKELELVTLRWENAYAKAYDLQISKDAKKWNTVYSTKEGKGKTENIELDTEKARYVRLKLNKRATQFGYSLFEMEVYGEKHQSKDFTPLHFIKLQLKDNEDKLLSENFYWRNGQNELDYTALNSLPKAKISSELIEKKATSDSISLKVKLKNNSNTVAFGNRLRLVNKKDQSRILPVLMNENYFTLFPNEEKEIWLEFAKTEAKEKIELLLKQYGKDEEKLFKLKI